MVGPSGSGASSDEASRVVALLAHAEDLKSRDMLGYGRSVEALWGHCQPIIEEKEVEGAGKRNRV